MGRRKREKKKKKRRMDGAVGAAPDNTAGTAGRPEQPDLGHLSGEWREFYRLVIDRLSSR